MAQTARSKPTVQSASGVCVCVCVWAHLQAAEGREHEVLSLSVHVAAHERLVEVAMAARSRVSGDVNVDNITVLDLVKVRNAVANDLVHRRAHALREVVVVERRRVALALDARLVDDAVNLVACRADAARFAGEIEDFAAHLARVPNVLELLARVHLYRTIGGLVLLRGGEETRCELRGKSGLDCDGAYAIRATLSLRSRRSPAPSSTRR